MCLCHASPAPWRGAIGCAPKTASADGRKAHHRPAAAGRGRSWPDPQHLPGHGRRAKRPASRASPHAPKAGHQSIQADRARVPAHPRRPLPKRVDQAPPPRDRPAPTGADLWPRQGAEHDRGGRFAQCYQRFPACPRSGDAALSAKAFAGSPPGHGRTPAETRSRHRAPSPGRACPFGAAARGRPRPPRP